MFETTNQVGSHQCHEPRDFWWYTATTASPPVKSSSLICFEKSQVDALGIGGLEVEAWSCKAQVLRRIVSNLSQTSLVGLTDFLGWKPLQITIGLSRCSLLNGHWSYIAGKSPIFINFQIFSAYGRAASAFAEFGHWSYGPATWISIEFNRQVMAVVDGYGASCGSLSDWRRQCRQIDNLYSLQPTHTVCVKFHWGLSQFISNVTNLLAIWHYASQPISFMQSNIVRFLYQPQLAQEHPLPPAWWCPTADVTRSCKSWRYKQRLHWSPGESQWQLRSHEIRSTLW